MSEYHTLIRINLQLFAGEKTEKATGRRRQEARKKGQVAKSVEINSAIILLLTFFVLKILGPYMLQELSSFCVFAFSSINQEELTQAGLISLFTITTLTVGKVVLPIAAIALVGGVTANIMQIGFLFRSDALVPDLTRLNPISGIKRLFTLRSLVELLKSALKIIIVAYVCYGAMKDDMKVFPNLLHADLRASLAILAQMTYDLVLNVGIILIVLAIFDYTYQKWEYEKSIRMSKEEVKEEYKMVEGDPKIKGKIKEKQRQISMRRMMQEIPKADVVITNPTHYAVALKYEDKNMDAPTVIAKGQDYVALRIRSLAEEAKVPLVENPPLAQSLYRTVEIGDEVPADLYQAVAEVLAFVYRLKGRI